ncbi:hypothetical protein QFC22_004319 [Naganishia vaughanmartiniae]|uniref:Uncharacterized protein n=1 Tax=Naganishia vaughanmartiniae TaxID=1424756 RepID=A0ACC2X225_9TREE|nr:hypothetical protein QFC22_004319 [Naganishia vaughanmartiniae]
MAAVQRNDRPGLDAPILMTLPAILQNPKSRTQAQVDSYATQQRERAQALSRKHAEDKYGDRASGVDRRKGEGKRSLRRRENAMLAHNPHTALPSRIDLLPPAPSYTPTFPKATSSAIRATSAPSPALPQPEPASSEAGKYTLSLKGVRQMLRRRGRRAEQVVQFVENELRGWSGAAGFGEQNGTHGTGFGQPRIIDDSVVDVTAEYSMVAPPNSDMKGAPIVQRTAGPEEPIRSLPRAFTTTSSSASEHMSNVLTSFYTADGVPTARAAVERKAIVELVREPGHLVWAVADGFERLIVHLLARYYELLSFSQTLPSAPIGDSDITPCYRITHILLSSQANPALPISLNLLTPENTDIDTDFGASSGTESAVGAVTSDSETETETERGDLTDSEADLGKSQSSLAESGVLVGMQDAESSARTSVPPFTRRQYASSESDDEAWTQVDISSATIRAGNELPLSPRVPSTFSQRAAKDRQLSGEWVHTDDLGSDAEGDISDNESVSSLMDSLILGTAAAPTRTATTYVTGSVTSAPDESPLHPFVSKFNLPIDLFPERRAPPQSGNGSTGRKQEKVTFFEYLYG